MIQFAVPGVPVPKQRPKFARRGRYVHAYTPQKTVDYEKLVADHARLAMAGVDPLVGPVGVRLSIYLPIPKSWTKVRLKSYLEGKVLPRGKVDVDNVFKSVADAMNGIVYVDDAQVTDLSSCKRYSELPGVFVEVWPIDAGF